MSALEEVKALEYVSTVMGQGLILHMRVEDSLVYPNAYNRLRSHRHW